MRQPDIIFIVLDTQRADRLGCYGYEKGNTPQLDRWSAEGVRFAQGIAPAQWTIPSHASMFTGLYPTVHQVTQSYQSLSWDVPTITEQLSAVGYETVAFCNNPLVGVLNNGFKRGFERFFNYGGATPNPYRSQEMFPLIEKTREGIGRTFRRFADPIQNLFGQSETFFRLSLNRYLTPIWSRLANFKGQNERSTRHLVNFLQHRELDQEEARPLFLFLNLMQTHLPFRPPQKFVDQTAPYLRTDQQAIREWQRWNREAYRWAAPLATPLSQIEGDVLSDLYDAEVAYQDSYLGALFATLRQRTNHENTLTIIVGDHGDGLGEHDCVGHAFVAYQELLHVPLILHWPEKIAPAQTVESAVSTRRVYHTMVDAGKGYPLREDQDGALSLIDTIKGNDREHGRAFAEVYPPLNFVNALAHRQPELLEKFRCTSLRRAVVEAGWKLIELDQSADELFDLSADPDELNNQLSLSESHPLIQSLQKFDDDAEEDRQQTAEGDHFAIHDKQLLQQLRNLGYIE